MRTVRAFNQAGIEAFREYLIQLRASPNLAPPFELLEDGSKSDSLKFQMLVDDTRPFANKWEFGKYLVEVLSPIARESQFERHAGLWSWLDLCFFNATCPLSNKGTRDPKSEYRHILSREYKNYYRHLVRTPWVAVFLHGEASRAMLAGEPSTGGEAAEALLSRQHLVENRGFFHAVDRLYVRSESSTWTCVTGARGEGGGSMRRLAKILKQYDLTYDLTVMTGDQIFELLPREFERFKK